MKNINIKVVTVAIAILAFGSPALAAQTKCADEGGICKFKGTAEVSYGANGKFSKKTLKGPVACDNKTFGDPIYGTRKACYLTKNKPKRSAKSFPKGYFKLTTMFREGEGECLEGNQRSGDMGGAAFMDTCQNVSGQSWIAKRSSKGYYKLTTQFRDSENECLEGNQRGGSMRGAAFMDSCQNVSGQLWKAIPAGNGYFKLTTMFREGEDECLEGNQRAGSMHGAAFMDSCQNVSGQLWIAKPQ